MPHPPHIAVATRHSWTIEQVPAARVALELTGTYSAGEFERLKRGLIPEAMEDKWFVFYEEPWLYFHRSWSGVCVFGIRLEPGAGGCRVAEAWASMEPYMPVEENRSYDSALLAFLIEGLLLGRDVSFPVPSNLRAAARGGVLQHWMIGRAFPERKFAVAQTRRSLLARLRAWLSGR